MKKCIVADLNHGQPIAIDLERVRAVVEADLHPVPMLATMGIVGVVLVEDACSACIRLGGSEGQIVLVDTVGGVWGLQVRSAERMSVVEMHGASDGWYTTGRIGSEIVRLLDVDVMVGSFVGSQP